MNMETGYKICIYRISVSEDKWPSSDRRKTTDSGKSQRLRKFMSIKGYGKGR